MDTERLAELLWVEMKVSGRAGKHGQHLMINGAAGTDSLGRLATSFTVSPGQVY